jgi:DNA-binding SARP family transcriptional activator
MLGGFRLLVDGREVPETVWQRKSARQILKYLLTRPQHRVLKEEVLELFWPESEPDAAATSLRTSVHRIRQALEPGARAADGSVIVVDRDTIALRPGVQIWIDADAFERLAQEAQRTGRPLALLEEACALYAGDYLPEDVDEDWAAQRRDALRRTWSELAFELAQAHLQRGDPQAAVPALQLLLRSDRCDERAAHELMRVKLQLGQRSEALRVFQSLETALREELGVEPSERTRALQRQLASQQGTRQRAVFTCAYSFPEPGQFIGREAELARLQPIIDAGRSSGQAVFISAPAGTGKSALAGALLRSARAAGVLCLAGAAYDERVGVPLAAFQEALTDYVLAASSSPLDADVADAASQLIETVRDVRDSVGATAGAQRDAGAERTRLFRAVLALLRKLAERGPVLLCLEDLHVADAATLNLLHYLLRQTRQAPIVFIGTLRSEALEPGEPLSQFMAAAQRERLAERLELPPLNEHATDRLIAALVGAPVHGNVSTSVYAATEGNPLFVEQLVFALREAGRLDRPAGLSQAVVVDASSLPHVVREVINERVSRLSARSRETLETAAVLGHAFEYDDLLAVVEPSDEALLLEDLDEAIRAQVIRERPTGYAFGHSLLRDGVYWGLTRTRRMLLHGRAGEVLERQAGAAAMSIAAELAFHFTRAGQTAAVRARAFNYSLRAGQAAAALESHREAFQHFETVCEMAASGTVEVDDATRLAMFQGRGTAEGGMGMWSASVATFRAVLEFATERTTRAAARQRICVALHHLGDTAGALTEAEAGLADLGPVSDGVGAAELRLELQHPLALIWFLKGRFDDVLRMGTDMVELAEQLEEPRWLAWSHCVVGWAHTGAGRVPLALEHYALAIAADERGGDRMGQAADRTNLGLEYYRGGRFAEAQTHLERAVTLYRESFSDLRAVLGLQGLGWVHLAQANLTRAQEYADLSAALAA